jgi:hypothetical protein
VDFVIDHIVMHSTPQNGTWLFCFEATAQGVTKQFHVPDEEYEDDEIKIPMGHVLRYPNTRYGELVSFWCRLDDDEDDVCTARAEDRSAGDFRARTADGALSGSASFAPQQLWRYTIYWHFE